MRIPCILVSTSYIILTLLLATVLRRLARLCGGNAFLKILADEAISAAELCGCCFELIIIADNYGVLMYAMFLFLLTIWWSLNWGAATACPYNHLEDYVEGKTDIRGVVFKVAAEILGGVLVFRYIQFLWKLEYADTHKGRAFEDCTADLQVSILYGAAIECVATCLCRLASRAIAEEEPQNAVAIDSFISTALVVAAFNYSGGYFNPVLATSLKFGCKGNTAIEHFIVYWLGSSLGSLIAVYLFRVPFIRGSLKKPFVPYRLKVE